jgi:cell division septum initiation protein DivIVA
MGVYEQIKQAFQDIVAPEIKTLQIEIRRLDGKIDSMKAEITFEIRRLDTRLDSLERELKLGIFLPIRPRHTSEMS